MNPPSRRKSCLRCALHKVKCTREPTCQECGKSGLLCQYNFEPSSKNTESNGYNRRQPGEDQALRSPPKRARLEIEEVGTSPGQQMTSMAPAQCQRPSSLENQASLEWGFSWNRESNSDMDNPTLVCQPDGSFGQQIVITAHRDDNDINRTSENHGVDSHGLFTPLRLDSGLTRHHDIGLKRSGPEHLSSEHWDLLFDMEDPQSVDLTSHGTSECQMPNLSDEGFPDFTIMPEDLVTVGSEFHQPSSTPLQTRQPSSEFLQGRGSSPNHERAPEPSIANAPGLVYEEIYRSISGPVEPSASEAGSEPAIEPEQSLARRIYQVMQQTSLGQSGLATDVPSTFPSSVQLSAFWDLYFLYFDRHCPILHRHLVKPVTCSPLIAAVVTVVGANYAESAQSRLFHQQGILKLSEVLQTSADCEGHDRNVEGSVLAAVCILLCHAIRSRNSQQARLLTTLFDANISCLEKVGLFRQQDNRVGRRSRNRVVPMSKNTICDCMAEIKNGNDLELHHRWLAWVEEETSRRLAWAYLAANYLASVFLHDRVLPDLEAPTLQMPCEDILWEAENTKVWSSCFPWSHTPPIQLPFRATLRGLLHQTIALRDVSRFGRLVCAALLHYELCRGSSSDEVEQRKSIAHLFSDGGDEQMLRLAADLADSFKRDIRAQL
ncbi:hypothetical protein Z517_08511 [Fonsecaea pedrosoi CBS 271.37]|uniref:Zn(2)-C6 fungal-type domain-containing protein n=1 Tax=Fonsecaea pedrosoi CBS 271.37 TaxID=1442368 RepID=A0A0D2GD49_9EURO|nr:uncharacterized protein Z517_08511 [Fonsecaea pedrosoi CBS 271.37]KIW78673.1 hypothetical protein Z517_08511 [Fonsecaea pedrosoi CBS 271.37]